MATPSDAQFGQAIVADAKRYLGVPYVYGGTDPKHGLDCSGLVQLVMHDLGISSFPRVTGQQQTMGTAVHGMGSAEPGDLLFEGFPISGHVAIYAGGGSIVEALHTGTNVKVDHLWFTPSYIRRISPPGGHSASWWQTILGGLGGLAGSGVFGGAVGGGIRQGGAIAGTGNAAVSAATGATKALDAAGTFLGHIGQRSTWIRVLQVIGGAALILYGAIIVGRGTITQAAMNTLPAGQAVQAISK